MKNLLLILLCLPLMFSCGDTNNLQREITLEMMEDGYTGKGTYTFSARENYVGEFKDGLAHGQGTATSYNGNKYVGEWKDNMKSGQGTFTWADGDKYVGEWLLDKQWGKGTYTHNDGRIEEGLFENNEFIGE